MWDPTRSPNNDEQQGFVLLDASSRIICANDEAVRILSYIHAGGVGKVQSNSQEASPKKQTRAPAEDLQRAFGEKVPPPLQALAQARHRGVNGYVFQIKSGRRTYFCRMCAMTSTKRSAHITVGMLFVLQRGACPATSRIYDQFFLTLREREVVELLLEGLCNKDIAQRMAISVFTVKAFLRTITMKMEVSSRSEIVAKILAIA